MKKKRYAGGGLTQADIDAGLTQADIDAGLRAGRNERISDEDRTAALRSAGTLSDKQAADLMGREVRMPEATPVPVAPRRAIPARPLSAAREESAEMSEEGPSASPGANRRPAPSRGDFDRNGPIGDFLDAIRKNARKGRGNPNPNIYPGESTNVPGAKRGGSVNKMIKSGASKRGDGIAMRGKTKGRMV